MLPQSGSHCVALPNGLSSGRAPARARRLRRRTRGATIVEFAMVMPVFLVLIAGTLEFGRAIMVQQILTNAAREGARIAIRPGETSSRVLTAVDNYLTSASVHAKSNVVALEWSPDLTTSKGTWTTVSNLNSVPSQSAVRLSVSAKADDVGWGIAWFTKGRTYTSQVIMRRE